MKYKKNLTTLLEAVVTEGREINAALVFVQMIDMITMVAYKKMKYTGIT